MKKLSDKDQVRLYKLHEPIRQGTYSGETVEIPVEIAMTILKKMVHACRLSIEFLRKAIL